MLAYHQDFCSAGTLISRLTGRRNPSIVPNCGRNQPLSLGALSKIVGFLAPALIPPVHIAYTYVVFKNYEYPVDRRHCKNACWDTVFKGPYENGIASYKHMYFNATDNFLKIWLLVVIGIISLYETVRYLTSLAFHRRLRLSMFVLFATSFFSNYYSWWICINYYNDEFYSQWNHQMYFTITELVSTLFILRLCDKDVEFTTRKAFAIVSIALLHIITSSYDQFVHNVLLHEGENHQVVRDLALMVTDVLNAGLPLYELLKTRKDLRVSDANTKVELMRSALIIGVLFVIYSFL